MIEHPTEMGKQEIQDYVTAACERLNALLPCKSQEDVDGMTEILKELFSLPIEPQPKMYWDREIWIDSGFNDEKCIKMLIYTDRLCFVPSDDWEEHPGVEVKYKFMVEKPFN